MKFYLSIILFTGLAIGQVEYVEDFLNNPKKLKLLKNYNLIKPELDKMLKNYKDQINFDNFWEEKYTETVFTGPVQRDTAAINSRLRNYMKNGFNGVPYSQWTLNEKKLIRDRVVAKFTGRPSKEVQKSRGKIIEINRHLYSKPAEWIEVVKFLGGYSKLGELGFKKMMLKNLKYQQN